MFGLGEGYWEWTVSPNLKLIVKFKDVLEYYMTNEFSHKLRDRIVIWQLVTYSDLTVVSTFPQLSTKRHRLVVVRQVIVTAVQSNSWRVPNE